MKVDYLRRVFYYEQNKEQQQIPYEFVYCFIEEKVPQLLTDARINPHDCNQRLLNNNAFSEVYVLGGDVFPTTQSLYAIGMQVHHVVHNITERLMGKIHQKKVMLTVY